MLPTAVAATLLFATYTTTTGPTLAAETTTPPAAQPPRPPSSWPASLQRAAAQLHENGMRAHTRFLAHDLLEGRAPGSRGGEVAMLYIASVFERLGLVPMGDGGTFFQRFEVLGKTTTAKAGRFEGPGAAPGKGESVVIDPGKNGVLATGEEQPSLRIGQAPVVFVGYGISAPEERWDDFKGQDVRGKILLVLNSDPSTDPKRFAGKTRLYYGRWTYKFEEAARRGAAGAIIIHTNESAGYPWQVVQTSWSGEQFALPKKPNEPRLPLEMWVTDETAHKIVALAGHKLEALVEQAQHDSFRPVALPVRFSTELTTKIRKVQTANVLGQLPGRDQTLRNEQVVFTAHHDHLGIGEAKSGDNIYNGALDNASGTAMMLSVAEALVAAQAKPKRSLLFAAVGAEESGLLGSEYLCSHLPVPAQRIAANLNVDGINIWGPTTDVTLLGLGKTSLDAVLSKLATGQKRTVVADAFADRGFYYRSDQFNFARIGVPAVNISHGVAFSGRPAQWGREQVEAWERTHYHQPSDELVTEWNLLGALQDAQLLLATGLMVADAPRLPTWKPGDEFEKVRPVP